MISRESYMKRIRPFMGGDLVKVLTGVRRCGKSVMLELIKEELMAQGVSPEDMLSYNFEDMSYMHLLDAKSLHDEIRSRIVARPGRKYLFFDEIQEVKDWERCINSLRAGSDCDIYITGSNARLLSGELATYLGGRYVEFVIYPFSYAEFLEAYRSIYPDTADREAFSRYLVCGGMPYLMNLRYEEGPSRQYLRDLFDSVQLKDVIRRNDIRDADKLERLVTYVMANIGNTFSATSISRYLKNEGRTMSPETVLNYLGYCMDAFLFYRAKRADLQGKQILSVNEKYYMVDHGIRQAVFGSNTRDINLVLENIVYMELLRRGYTVTVGKIGDLEIDLIGEKDGKRIYMQVCYILASEETVEREFGPYRYVKDNYPKYVVSMDEIDMSRDGIIHKNVRDLLTSEDW